MHRKPETDHLHGIGVYGGHLGRCCVVRLLHFAAAPPLTGPDWRPIDPQAARALVGAYVGSDLLLKDRFGLACDLLKLSTVRFRLVNQR